MGPVARCLRLPVAFQGPLNWIVQFCARGREAAAINFHSSTRTSRLLGWSLCARTRGVEIARGCPTPANRVVQFRRSQERSRCQQFPAHQNHAAWRMVAVCSHRALFRLTCEIPLPTSPRPALRSFCDSKTSRLVCPMHAGSPELRVMTGHSPKRPTQIVRQSVPCFFMFSIQVLAVSRRRPSSAAQSATSSSQCCPPSH